MPDSAQDFRNVETALDVLRAYRMDLTVPVQENPDFQLALVKHGTAETPEELGAQLGRLVQGQVVLINILIEAIASTSGKSADDVVQAYEDQTQAMIAQLEQE